MFCMFASLLGERTEASVRPFFAWGIPSGNAVTSSKYNKENLSD